MRRTSLALRILVFASLAAGPPEARALQTNTAGNASEFLRVGAGARALGMGEAYGPVAEGVEALYWNPAGLSQIKSPEFSYTRSEFMKFFHHDFAGYAQPLGGSRGTLAVAYTRLSQDSMPLVSNTNESLGSFSPHSDVMTLGYGFVWPDEDTWAFKKHVNNLLEREGAAPPLYHDARGPWEGSLMMGLAAKVISDTINTRRAVTAAADGGVLFRPREHQEFTLSFAFRNAGGKQKFLDQEENLPFESSVGLAYDYQDGPLRLLPAAEAVMPYYGNPYGKVGVEVSHALGGTVLSYRAGYKTLAASDLSPLAGLTGGLGIRYGRRVNVDLGFQPLADLGQVYRITLGLRW